MSSDWSAVPQEELERAVVGAARFVAYPDLPDLSELVAGRLHESPRRRWADVFERFRRHVARPVLRPALGRVAVAVVVVVAVLAGTLVFSPSARRAVAGWLGLRGVKIQVVPSPSLPLLGRGLDLGKRMTLSEAQGRVSFRIEVPTALGPPDEVYLRTGFIQDQVTLLYRARPGLPRAALTGAGLLLTEFRARVDTDLIEKKVAPEVASVESAPVRGEVGFWIAGEPHFVLLLGPDGKVVEDRIRLAGNVLLWEHGEVTLRIEADISKGQALALAESVR